MKFFLRALGLLILAILGFGIVSYVLFGNDPAARLKAELDHDLPVGAITIETRAQIDGCRLNLTLTQRNADKEALEGERLDVALPALAAAAASPGAGYIGFALPQDSPARCTTLNGEACPKATRPEIQLNMPGVTPGDKATRVLGWINALAQSCAG